VAKLVLNFEASHKVLIFKNEAKYFLLAFPLISSDSSWGLTPPPPLKPDKYLRGKL